MDPLDRDIRRALAVDPSAAFLAGVRTRIAAEPPPGRRFPWMIVAPAVFAMAVIAIVVIVSRPPVAAPELLAARASVSSVGGLPGVERVYRPDPREMTIRPEQPSMPRTNDRPREPEVLIAADEMKALRQLILGVREGWLDVAPVLEATPVTAPDPAPLDTITIPAIAITPLVGEQGARP